LDQAKVVLKYFFYSEAFDLRHEIRESSSHAEAEEFAQNGDEVKISKCVKFKHYETISFTNVCSFFSF
jgi:hypothetical protein